MKTFTFYISSGRKHAQYTLREIIEDDSVTDNRWRKMEGYVCNLGNDKTRALKKAKEIVNDFKSKLTQNNNSRVVDNTSADFSLNPYGSQPIDGWDAKNLLIVEDEGVFPYGKHTDVKFEDTPDNYVLWWADKEIVKGGKKATEAIINACRRVAIHKGLFDKRVAYEKEKAEKRETELANQNYVGTVGDRMNFKITVDFIKGFDTQYGWSYVVKGKDSDGNAIVYFGTAELGNVGDTVEFSAKVKKHDTYGDDKQTTVNRPTKIKVVSKGEETLANEKQQELLNHA